MKNWRINCAFFYGNNIAVGTKYTEYMTADVKFMNIPMDKKTYPFIFLPFSLFFIKIYSYGC